MSKLTLIVQNVMAFYVLVACLGMLGSVTLVYIVLQGKLLQRMGRVVFTVHLLSLNAYHALLLPTACNVKRV